MSVTHAGGFEPRARLRYSPGDFTEVLVIDRRGLLATGATLLAMGPAFAQRERIEPAYLDDGRPTQPWFLNSFLILKEDLADAAARGRRFAILWDQRGCPYCLEMHKVNLADPGVSRYIRERFDILQLDMLGSREVTDFDGQVLSEKELARKYGVVGTPTIQFLPEHADAVDGKKGRAVEVARMPGYFKPEPFIAMFEYVAARAYEREPFAQYVKTRGQSGTSGIKRL
jgi:thioredoxin-related protein